MKKYFLLREKTNQLQKDNGFKVANGKVYKDCNPLIQKIPVHTINYTLVGVLANRKKVFGYDTDNAERNLLNNYLILKKIKVLT